MRTPTHQSPGQQGKLETWGRASAGGGGLSRPRHRAGRGPAQAMVRDLADYDRAFGLDAGHLS